MSDLNNPAHQTGNSEEGAKPTPTGTMLFTILLLTAGFLLASALMMHHAMKGQTEAGFGWLAAVAKIKSIADRSGETARPKAEEAGEENASPLENIREMIASQGDGAVRWPKLELAGFGTSIKGDNNFAIINGSPVYPDQFIGKVKLVEVRSHYVIVEYQGEQKTLSVGIEKPDSAQPWRFLGKP